MNPLVLWLEHHQRAQWQTQEVRDAYAAVYGAATDAQWRSALGQAYQRESVVEALNEAHGNAYVGTALAGRLSFGDTVTIRFAFRGTDVGGHSVHGVIDVEVGRYDRIRDLPQLARRAADQSAKYGGVQVDELEVLPGSYAS